MHSRKSKIFQEGKKNSKNISKINIKKVKTCLKLAKLATLYVLAFAYVDFVRGVVVVVVKWNVIMKLGYACCIDIFKWKRSFVVV